MAKDKVSRRDFLAKSSLAASTTVAAGSMDDVKAQEAEQSDPADYSLRTRALVSVLTRKGLVDPASMDAVVDYHENQVGPHIGANVVAKSWVDPGYRERLLADARAVARDDGITGFQSTDLVAVENTPAVHNLVVCTLCS